MKIPVPSPSTSPKLPINQSYVNMQYDAYSSRLNKASWAVKNNHIPPHCAGWLENMRSMGTVHNPYIYILWYYIIYILYYIYIICICISVLNRTLNQLAFSQPYSSVSWPKRHRMINMVRIHRPLNVWPVKKRLVYGQSEVRSTFFSCLMYNLYIYIYR